MFENILFIIRNGDFGTDYFSKLLFLIFSLIVCFYDFKKNNRKDYFFIFLIGTFIWFLVEFSVQALGIRVTEAFMFGLPLPIFIAALLRGAAEGGFIILFGVFFADRLNKKWILTFLILCVLVFSLTLLTQQGVSTNGEVASRRDLLNTGGLVYMSLMIIFDIFWLSKTTSKIRKRAIYSLLAMIIFTGAWTLGEYLAGTRWIELGSVLAPSYLQFIGLSYDVIVEIGLAYIPFLGLAYMLGLIKEK